MHAILHLCLLLACAAESFSRLVEQDQRRSQPPSRPDQLRVKAVSLGRSNPKTNHPVLRRSPKLVWPNKDANNQMTAWANPYSTPLSASSISRDFYESDRFTPLVYQRTEDFGPRFYTDKVKQIFPTVYRRPEGSGPLIYTRRQELSPMAYNGAKEFPRMTYNRAKEVPLLAYTGVTQVPPLTFNSAKEGLPLSYNRAKEVPLLAFNKVVPTAYEQTKEATPGSYQAFQTFKQALEVPRVTFNSAQAGMTSPPLGSLQGNPLLSFINAHLNSPELSGLTAGTRKDLPQWAETAVETVSINPHRGDFKEFY